MVDGERADVGHSAVEGHRLVRALRVGAERIYCERSGRRELLHGDPRTDMRPAQRKVKRDEHILRRKRVRDAAVLGVAAVADANEVVRRQVRPDLYSNGPADPHWLLPHAIEGFFTNGGKRVYVTRVLDTALARRATT
ncbi:MAG: hypothetical protein ACLPV4_20710, partial [Solirubrobacteraceae bacterium]